MSTGETRHIRTSDYQGPDRRDSAWHLSRTIMTAVIGLLVTNIGASIWWASSVESRLQSLGDEIVERTNDRYPGRQAAADNEVQNIRIAAVEKLVEASVLRTENEVQRLNDKFDKLRDLIFASRMERAEADHAIERQQNGRR